MYSRIIVPLDGSALAETALSHATALAERFEAPVTLVRALSGPGEDVRGLSGIAESLDPDTPLPSTTEAQSSSWPASRRVADYLADHAANCRARGLSVDTVIGDAPAAGLILDVAQGAPGAIIVMATHGRGGLGRLLFGSTAQAVLARTTIPVLLIPARTAAAAPPT